MAARRGESLLDPSVTERVLERVRRIAAGDLCRRPAHLTRQERKILLLLADGSTNKQIADARSSCRTRPSRTT